MPNCFELTRKADGGYELLHDVDNKMREALGHPADPYNWLHWWYDVLGLSFACGKSFMELRSRYAADTCPTTGWLSAEYVKIIDWLDANYTVTSWYQHK